MSLAPGLPATTERTAAPPRRSPARIPAWCRETAWGGALGSLLLVILLWAGAGGVGDLTSGWAPALTSGGRVLGLIASDLLLLQVLLMARIPAVERSHGQDELARVHRLVGFWSFTLMLAHIALITLGYASTDGRNPLAELWELVWTYPGMLLAAAGTGLLVLVVATSIRAARRRLRYESWHLLHLYAYLGVGLALPHQLWTGSEFVANPLARAYWWTAWAATAGAVVVFRLGLPLYRSLGHRLVVSAVVPEAPGIVSLHLTGRRLEKLPVRAGQFFLLRFLAGPGSSRAHPFSLSAAPHPCVLRFTVKDLGDGSRRVADLRPGTPVLFEGPYGRLTAERRTRCKVLLLGAGIGITPLRALAEELEQEPGDVMLLYRVHSDADVVFDRELDTLRRARGLRVQRLAGRRPADRPSFLPAALAAEGDVAGLRRLVPDVAEREVYVCGPDAWMDVAIAAAREAGVPREHVHAERFSW